MNGWPFVHKQKTDAVLCSCEMFCTTRLDRHQPAQVSESFYKDSKSLLLIGQAVISRSQLSWPPAPVPGWAGPLPWRVVPTARGPRTCIWLLSAVEVRLLLPNTGYSKSLIGVLSSGSQCRASVWWQKNCLRDSSGIVTFFFSAPIVSHILTVSLLTFLLSQALLTFWIVVITILNTSVESLGAVRSDDSFRHYASQRFLGLEVLCLLGKRSMRIVAEVLRHELEGWHSLPWWRYRLSLRTAVTGIWMLVAYTEDDSQVCCCRTSCNLWWDWRRRRRFGLSARTADHEHALHCSKCCSLSAQLFNALRELSVITGEYLSSCFISSPCSGCCFTRLVTYSRSPEACACTVTSWIFSASDNLSIHQKFCCYKSRQEQTTVAQYEFARGPEEFQTFTLRLRRIYLADGVCTCAKMTVPPLMRSSFGFVFWPVFSLLVHRRKNDTISIFAVSKQWMM